MGVATRLEQVQDQHQKQVGGFGDDWPVEEQRGHRRRDIKASFNKVSSRARLRLANAQKEIESRLR